MRRLVLLPALLAFLVGAVPALAWTWPVDGPVLQSFALGGDPYASGQHRGIDVGGAEGAPVLAPATGTVTFAGAVPAGGRSITIQTPDATSHHWKQTASGSRPAAIAAAAAHAKSAAPSSPAFQRMRSSGSGAGLR